MKFIAQKRVKDGIILEQSCCYLTGIKQALIVGIQFLMGLCLIFLHVVSNFAFVLDCLFKNICIVDSHGRQRYYLPTGAKHRQACCPYMRSKSANLRVTFL